MFGMRKSRTIRVTLEAHAALRALAETDGLTLSEELTRLARSERQRRLGLSLATASPDSMSDSEEEAWLNVGLRTVIAHGGR